MGHDDNHAAKHINGTDDIQDATASQKGLMTATAMTKLNTILVPPITTTLCVDGNRVDAYTEDGSEAKPYKTIQAAITGASSGTLIIIVQGIYTEDLTLKPGVYLKSMSGIQPGVTVTGKVSWPSGAGTILMSGIYVYNTADHAIEFSGVALQKLRAYNCKFETNSNGVHHALNHSNTHADSEIFLKDSLVQVLDSSGGAKPIETVITSQGSIGLDNTTVRIADDIDNTAINLCGAIAYWQRMDEIRGRVIVSDLASCNISLDGMYASTLSVVDTNSAGLSILSSVVISTTASPAVTGAGVFAYSGVTYISSGTGLAATLNGGLGPDVGALPFDSAMNVISDTTDYGRILSAADDTVQKALDTIDDISVSKRDPASMAGWRITPVSNGDLDILGWHRKINTADSLSNASPITAGEPGYHSHMVVDVSAAVGLPFDITITGMSVNETTGATTPGDTEVISVTANGYYQSVKSWIDTVVFSVIATKTAIIDVYRTTYWDRGNLDFVVDGARLEWYPSNPSWDIDIGLYHLADDGSLSVIKRFQFASTDAIVRAGDDQPGKDKILNLAHAIDGANKEGLIVRADDQTNIETLYLGVNINE